MSGPISERTDADAERDAVWLLYTQTERASYEHKKAVEFGWDAATRAAAEREAQLLLPTTDKYLEARCEQARAEGALKERARISAWLKKVAYADIEGPGDYGSWPAEACEALEWAADRLGEEP